MGFTMELLLHACAPFRLDGLSFPVISNQNPCLVSTVGFDNKYFLVMTRRRQGEASYPSKLPYIIFS